MFIKDLVKKFKIKNHTIPQTILDIEIEEEVKNWTDYTIEDNVYSFTGEYKPSWYDGKNNLIITLIIDLTPFDETILSNVDDIDQLAQSPLTDEQYEQLISAETVTLSKTIKDNFYSFITYNIMGGMVSIS